MPPIDFCNNYDERAQTRALRTSLGRGPQPTSVFASPKQLLAKRLETGEPHAASHAPRPRGWFLPRGGLPRRDTYRARAAGKGRNPYTTTSETRCEFEGLSEGCVPGQTHTGEVGAYAARTRTTCPSSATLRTSVVAGATERVGGTPRRQPDQPRPTLHRPSAKTDGFLQVRMPSTITRDRGTRSELRDVGT